jgi:hypothetical protein
MAGLGIGKRERERDDEREVVHEARADTRRTHTVCVLSWRQGPRGFRHDGVIRVGRSRDSLAQKSEDCMQNTSPGRWCLQSASFQAYWSLTHSPESAGERSSLPLRARRSVSSARAPPVSLARWPGEKGAGRVSKRCMCRRAPPTRTLEREKDMRGGAQRAERGAGIQVGLNGERTSQKGRVRGRVTERGRGW